MYSSSFQEDSSHLTALPSNTTTDPLCGTCLDLMSLAVAREDVVKSLSGSIILS